MRDRGIPSTLTPEEKTLCCALDLRMQYEGGTPSVETPTFNGNSRPWDNGAMPNSIYEQFNRQDFDHPHFDKNTQQYYQPHEHSYHYNENGYRDGVWDGPLTPGYNNLPTQ